MKRGLLVIALVLAFPANAWAHATLRHTQPGYRQRVQTSPPAVVLWFDQAVKALPDSIEVRTATGRLVSRAARTRSDAHYAVASLRRLPRGAYTVRWHVISSDGHVVSGVYTFGVRMDAPPPTEAYGASGPTWTEHFVRWLYFLSLALLLGGLAFRLLVVRGPLPRKAERRFFTLAFVGAVATIEAGIVAFFLRAEDALQLPFVRFLYGNLSPVAVGTRFGTAFIAMTLGFALVTAFVFLAWLTERRLLLWPALLLGFLFASGLSLSGHSSDSGSLASFADWVHLSAATLWLGGLLQLGLVVWPGAPQLRRDVFIAFSRFATVLIALIVGAGIYLSVLRLPALHDLWTTGYGHVLLVKLSLVSVALLWGAMHHFVARPVLERAPDHGLLARLVHSLRGESAVAMAVLLVAAVLVDSKPPPQPPRAPTQASNVR